MSSLLGLFLFRHIGGIFGSLFGRKPGDRSGEDLRYTLTVTLEESAVGLERSIEVPRQVKCKRCVGDGADPDGGG